MKFKKPFYLSLTPYYVLGDMGDDTVRDEITELRADEIANGVSYDDLVNHVVEAGGETEDGKVIFTGGRFDWQLVNVGDVYNGPDRNHIVDVQLMRLWAIQLFTQMVADKAYINEVKSEPKFELSEEEKTLLNKITTKMNLVLSKELLNIQNSFINKRKMRFTDFSKTKKEE